MNHDLLNKAWEIQHSDVINLKKNEKDYAFTFIYPPSKVLYPIESSEIEGKKITEANLYVHIPYCTGRCTYCYFGCYSIASAPITKSVYVEKICSEMKMVTKYYGRVKLLSIHFGGGTPTTLSEDEINRIFRVIRECFVVGENIETINKGAFASLQALEKITVPFFGENLDD